MQITRPSPRENDPIGAGLIAEIVAAVNRLDREMRTGGWGLVASMLAAKLPDIWVPAVITRIYPGDAGASAYPASAVFYDVMCVGQPSTLQEHVQPDLGRPVSNPSHQIHAALVHHPAVIIRTHDV